MIKIAEAQIKKWIINNGSQRSWMMAELSEIIQVVRQYLIGEFFEGGTPDELTDSTPLISGGILDSISTLQLVSFLERRFKIEFKPNEVDQDNLNTISLIALFVKSKIK